MIHDSKQKDLSSNVVHALKQTQLTAQHQRKNRYIPSESIGLPGDVVQIRNRERKSTYFSSVSFLSLKSGQHSSVQV